jgi:DNA-binding GntR family transcriptional regulator
MRMYDDTHIQLSAGERAYRTLLKRIVSLELKPNESIGEQMLAESLGVSRTPVREALSRLASEGLVDVRSRSGGVVAPIRLEAVKSAQFVREALEVAIINKAVQRKDTQILFNLRQSIEAQRFAVAEKNSMMFFDADERMHSLFCQLAGQAYVWGVIADAKQHMDRVRRISLDHIDLDTLLTDHIELYQYIEQADKVGARKILRRHLRRVLVDLERLREQCPEFFECTTAVSDISAR